MDNLYNTFERFREINVYQRVDSMHPLDLYVGIDDLSRWTLLLICDSKPRNLTSSKMIVTRVGHREDNRWSISLSLKDDTYAEMFVLFCGDIIDSSRSIRDKKKAARFITNRYNEWRNMLANAKNELLSGEEAKGLLGEMYFLDLNLMDHFGAEKAALSWMGPKGAHQDYIVDDTWYEIKTVSSGREEIRISSIEQLDCENRGKLVIVYADKTSLTNERAINLNVLYRRLMSRFSDDDAKAEFCNMLLRYGYYPRREYETEEYTYEVKGISYYSVPNTFPCLRRSGLPYSIVKAEYYLSLPAIQEYREDDIVWN